MTLSQEEQQLIMHLMTYAQREGLPAMQHPAWNTLAGKLQHLQHAPKLQNGSSIEGLVRQGYTEKVAGQILELK